MHRRQEPHFSSQISSFSSKGASVNTVVQRTRGPYTGWIKRQFFPIQPNPAKRAMALWETEAQIRLLSMRLEAGIGITLYPAF